jgi:DNA-binding transcriptional LysR family regulator
MSVRQLRSFIAVSEHGSISGAAEALFLSVPAVSAQLKRLEDEFKTPLFDRARKPARLTAAGKALLPKAREIVMLYDQVPEAISAPHDVAGSLVLGAIPTALTSVIPAALLFLQRQYPRLQIRVHHGLSPTFADQLQHGEIDAAIISEPRNALNGISWEPFAEEPVMVIASRQAVGRNDEALLSKYPYIRFNRHFWVSRQIEESLIARRIVLRETMELDSLEAIALMVRHGLGVSIVPVSHRGFTRFHQLRATPFGRPPLLRKIGLAERTENPKKRLTGTLLAALRRTMT